MKARIRSLLDRMFSGLARTSDVENVYRQLSALMEVKEIIGPGVMLGPLRGWALSPDALLIILHDIVERKSPRVVEFGSGESTVAIAAALRMAGGGFLVSIEHNAEFGAEVEGKLKRRGLEDLVDLRTVPLRRYEGWAGFVSFESYDLEGHDSEFDVAIVDGPIATFGAATRGVPVEWAVTRLKDDGAIYLDDASRSDEWELVDRMQALLRDTDREWIDCEKGLLRLTRKANKPDELHFA
ncbi:MAG: class I SAM-dependent methyltransferase [bacterium]|nr:class I SAM-dependent methyltransferase [bacterium]